MLEILPRSAWTTTPNKRAGRTLVKSATTSITLHYPAVGNINLKGESKAQTAKRLEAWRKLHVGPSRGWADIGYNYAVDQAGRVWFLTGYNVGAHAGSTVGNKTSIGVLLILGDNEDPTDEMINAVRSFRQQTLKTYTKATAVKGHRDWKSTSCPGSKAYALIKSGTFSKSPSDISPPDPVAPKPKPTPVKPSIPKTVRFYATVWNVTSETYSDSPGLWKNRGPQLAKYLKSPISSSLYGLNEVVTYNMSSTISEYLGSKFKHSGSAVGNDVWFDSQKFTIKNAREFRVPNIKQKRSIKWTELERDGVVFNLLVVHFPNGSVSQRRTMANYLVNLVKNWKDPIILMGDFNNTKAYTGSPRAILKKAGYVAGLGKGLDDIMVKGASVSIEKIETINTSSKWSTHKPVRALIQFKA